jgi:uncharacterized membrane protein YbhN (UPF0104 family)
VSNKQKVKGYKRFYPWLKWILSIASIYFFVKSIKEIEGDIFGDIVDGILDHPMLFAVICFLALVNWNAEAQKFKLLISSEIKLTNLKALLTILGGMAISNFTPARTGEYIGRGLLLKKVHPVKVVIATVAGNVAQVLMTYGLGLLCLVYLVFFTDFVAIESGPNMWYVAFVITALVIVIWNAKRIIAWVKPKLPKNIAKTFSIVKKYNKRLFLKVTGIAFLRYLAFSIQFYLLLQLFSDFSLPVTGLILVPLAYLMQSLAPVPAVLDIGVREYVSLLLFGDYLPKSAIVQAVTCLWFINLILPGAIGTIYLLISTKFKR